ncbi:GNAT family N-acetyltransferase [uncultured Aquitalea sp.]|uniref:GNAT family N-acetyltransferase n=1 Tax=uncultured Aquitalea sp. TaxID=540272 RepID=UPI0025F347A4|nr:GNAT family N-acetyltransferase [uncultured Aquitalea sp.]
MNPAAVGIRRLDLSQPADSRLLARLTAEYAAEARGTPLDASVTAALPAALATHPGLLAWLAEENGEPLGHALCMLGFSSYRAAPVMNLHDLAVRPAARGRGLARRLLAAVEEEARRLACARLTLEVSPDNQTARRLYRSAGFCDSHPDGLPHLMLEKPL